MADNIVRSLDAAIESFSSEEESEKMDLSLLTQADPASSGHSSSAEYDESFLDSLFQRAERIVHGTPKKSSPPAGSKRQEIQISRIQHNMRKLAMDKAKSSRNLEKIQQQIRAGRCPISLRYKASPRLRRDEIFLAAHTQLVKDAQQSRNCSKSYASNTRETY